MPEMRFCNRCGNPLPSDAPEGICPACTLRAGLEPDTRPMPEGSSRGFQTPILWDSRIPDIHAFVTVPHIHSFAARTFGAKPLPLVISNTQKEGARRSAKGGCLPLLS
jgi:hypothetical protein